MDPTDLFTEYLNPDGQGQQLLAPPSRMPFADPAPRADLADPTPIASTSNARSSQATAPFAHPTLDSMPPPTPPHHHHSRSHTASSSSGSGASDRAAAQVGAAGGWSEKAVKKEATTPPLAGKTKRTRNRKPSSCESRSSAEQLRTLIALHHRRTMPQEETQVQSR